MVTETAKAEPLLITLFLVEASASKRHTTMGMFEICLGARSCRAEGWAPCRAHGGDGGGAIAFGFGFAPYLAGTGAVPRGLFRDAAGAKLDPFPPGCGVGWY